VKACLTVPNACGSRTPYRERSAFSPSAPSASGTPHRPPRACPSRFSRTYPCGARRTRAVARTDLGLRARGAGYRPASFFPAQDPATGQEAQRGSFGVHTVAPSSIIAWFHERGSSGSRSPSAVARSQRALGSSAANRRARTRRTFPSTAATGSPNAIEATAAAV